MSKNRQGFCTFYIVRHGETQWNRAGILQGQKDSPLTEEALRAAAKRSKDFKKIDFADAFSSDLFRSQRTAEIIAAEHKLAVTTNKLIRERAFGEYDGMKITEFREKLREKIEYRESLSEKEQFSHKLRDDIESDEEIVTRLITFIRETAIAYPDKNVLVVAHGAIMRAFLIHLGFGNYQELAHGAISNLGYFVLESDGVEFFIKKTAGINKTTESENDKD